LPPPITVPGNYVLGDGAYSITINASNVDLDLNGFTVGNNLGGVYGCPLISGGSAPGCTALAGSATTPPIIKVTGSNVTIHNGTVEGGAGDGIDVAPVPGTFLNVVLKDLAVDNNRRYGISIVGAGATLSNVRVYQNGLDGIVLSDQTRLEHVTASYNNGSGINGGAGSGNYYDVVVARNLATGITANGSLDKIEAKYNGGTGMVISGCAIRMPN
jgi:hypothetical protein